MFQGADGLLQGASLLSRPAEEFGNDVGSVMIIIGNDFGTVRLLIKH